MAWLVAIPCKYPLVLKQRRFKRYVSRSSGSGECSLIPISGFPVVPQPNQDVGSLTMGDGYVTRGT